MNPVAWHSSRKISAPNSLASLLISLQERGREGGREGDGERGGMRERDLNGREKETLQCTMLSRNNDTVVYNYVLRNLSICAISNLRRAN